VLTTSLSVSVRAENAICASLLHRLRKPVERLADYQLQAFLSTPFLNASSTAAEAISKLQESFFARAVEDRLLAMTDSSPELTRILSVQIAHWRRFFATFNRAADSFVRRQRWDTDVGIARLTPDISDHHRNNATVIYVGFSNGEEWYYKPRDAGQTTAWFDLLSQINEEGFSHPFTVPRVISAGRHHWMEAIKERRCANEFQLNRFMFRMGALLYLLDVLRGVDFHAGNLVCQGVQPVFVDCETLMHPETPMPRRSSAQERGLLRVGVLPLKGAPDATVAALGPVTLARVLPSRGSFSLDTITSTVVNGFRGMHEFFAEGNGARLAILKNAAVRLGHSQCRAIYRPTANYHYLLHRSLAPDLLSDTAKRLAFLRTEAATTYLPKRITYKEAAALRDLDIPFFIRRASSRQRIPSRRKMWQSSCQIRESLAQVSRFASARLCLARASANGLRGSPVK
jgi:lantibiotic modifying enzyme